MRRDLAEIRNTLTEISEKEATYLYRLAWRMQDHGCSKEAIDQVREEARLLHLSGYPERLLDPFREWKYAFKI